MHGSKLFHKPVLTVLNGVDGLVGHEFGWLFCWMIVSLAVVSSIARWLVGLIGNEFSVKRMMSVHPPRHQSRSAIVSMSPKTRVGKNK